MDFSILQQFGLSLALGSLIGLEREHRQQKDKYDDFGGIRTFALIAIFGNLSYLLSDFSILLPIVLTAGFLVLIISAYVMGVKKDKFTGITSEIASIVVFLLGILSGMEEYFLAVIIAMITLAILHFKKTLHFWAEHVSSEEILSTMQFMIVAFVVLPVLPNEFYGPYNFFNPYIVWLMVVFISGISFASYIAMRIFGKKRGIALSGFLGGFTSSTALTFSISEKSKEDNITFNPYISAILIASSAMFFRVLFEVFILNKSLLNHLFIPMTAMGVTGVLITFYFLFLKEKPSRKMEENVKISSPFKLKPALKFGVLFALMMLAVKAANSIFGESGVYITSFFSGIMDVDAITVSMANLAKNGLSDRVASLAILIATITNTFSKAGIFLLFGNRKSFCKVLTAFSIIVAVGIVSVLLT